MVDELESAKIQKGNRLAGQVPGDVVTASACGASSQLPALSVWESEAAEQATGALVPGVTEPRRALGTDTEQTSALERAEG